MQKPKAYLSFPISGLNIAIVEAKAAEAKRTVERLHPEWDVINPLDLGRDIEKELTLSPREKYAKEMGRDIEIILQADVFIYVSGIGDMPSTGCLMEEAVVDRWNFAHKNTQIEKFFLYHGELYKEWKGSHEPDSDYSSVSSGLH